MLLTMAADNVRLNYTISDAIDAQLTSYCELTGRTASDLVRQLVSEVLENDRDLPPLELVDKFIRDSDRRDRRTDMWMSARYLAALDEKLEEGGYPSKSAVIAYLLHEFLNARANHAGTEMVRVATFVDRLTYMYLVEEASKRLCSVEEVITALCRESVLPDELKNPQRI
jgi:Arc/MetJ-type ribon-helix-helix transcriptional regulator